MKSGDLPFDEKIEQLLIRWLPKIGQPSCGAGCSACCQTSTVIVSTVEAGRVLDHFEAQSSQSGSEFRKRWQQNVARIRKHLAADMSEQDAIDVLVNQGSCVFLSGKLCGIYEARPDPCRSFYVWHSPEYCGRLDFDMCSPAELKEVRINQLYDAMRREIRAGRIPFWGHLLVMVSIMDQHRAAYENGEALCGRVDPIWSQTGLVRFFDPRATRSDMESVIDSEQAEFKRLFAEEPWPLGAPKVANTTSRQELDAFPIDVPWLRSAMEGRASMDDQA